MADFYTSILAYGTEAELTAMLQVLRRYSCVAKAQYQTSRDCWYLDTNEFDTLSPEKIAEFIGDGRLKLLIPGPYGVVYDPFSDYQVLFTDLADAAPMAQFDIRMEGFDVGGDLSAAAVLRGGKLYFDTDYRDAGSESEPEMPDDPASGTVLAKEQEETVLNGLTFVVTGNLKKFKNRNAITIFIEERGGAVGSSVTKKTNYLINNAKRSKTAKNNKAAELGIPVITEAEFLEQFGLEYQPHKSKKGKLYEAGYYDPIRHKFQPPRKLKKEPLTIQIAFTCADQTTPVLQIDLDVADYMLLSCTPDMILGCKDLDDLERILLDSVTGFDERVSEFRALFAKKWQPVKQAIKSRENIERMVLRRVDVRRSVRLMSWDRLFFPDLKPLALKAALCKPAQKAECTAAFAAYLDEQMIWYPWADGVPDWPTKFCGFRETGKLDWRSLTDDAELFAKMIVAEELAELDHGEERTVIDFKTGEFQQSAVYYPGW